MRPTDAELGMLHEFVSLVRCGFQLEDVRSMMGAETYVSTLKIAGKVGVHRRKKKAKATGKGDQPC